MKISPSPGVLMREVARLYVRSQRAQASCRDGASTVQCHVLTELSRHDDLPLKGLVQRLGLDKAWLSRAVDGLIEEGMVVKKPNPSDRRSVSLSLTRSGCARAKQLERELNGHATTLMDAIPRERHAQIQESLHLLLDALQKDESVRKSASDISLPKDVGSTKTIALSVRPARPADWAAVKCLLTSAKLPLEGAQEHFDQFLIGELDNKLVCAAGLEVYGRSALLRSVVVSDFARGNGYARQLTTQLVQHGRRQGLTKLFLLTSTAAAYFTQLGFSEVSRKAVPSAVQQSREFQGACPSSAIAMSLRLNTD